MQAISPDVNTVKLQPNATSTNRWEYFQPNTISEAWSSSQGVLAKVTNAVAAIFKQLGAFVLNTGIGVGNFMYRLITPAPVPEETPIVQKPIEENPPKTPYIPQEPSEEPEEPDFINLYDPIAFTDLPEPKVPSANWTGFLKSSAKVALGATVIIGGSYLVNQNKCSLPLIKNLFSC